MYIFKSVSVQEIIAYFEPFSRQGDCSHNSASHRPRMCEQIRGRRVTYMGQTHQYTYPEWTMHRDVRKPQNTYWNISSFVQSGCLGGLAIPFLLNPQQSDIIPCGQGSYPFHLPKPTQLENRDIVQIYPTPQSGYMDHSIVVQLWLSPQDCLFVGFKYYPAIYFLPAGSARAKNRQQANTRYTYCIGQRDILP